MHDMDVVVTDHSSVIELCEHIQAAEHMHWLGQSHIVSIWCDIHLGKITCVPVSTDHIPIKNKDPRPE